MYVCVYVCMHACLYVCMYVSRSSLQMNGQIYGSMVCMHTCMYMIIYVFMPEGQVYKWMHRFMEVWYVCMHTCLYVNIYVCMEQTSFRVQPMGHILKRAYIFIQRNKFIMKQNLYQYNILTSECIQIGCVYDMYVGGITSIM